MGNRDRETAHDRPPASDSEPTSRPTPPRDEGQVRDERDQRWIRRVRQGDEAAFRELVLAYQDRIFGLTLRMVGNRQEAEDVTQEVFLIVHRAIDSYRGEARFYTWLYKIASNTCKNRIKYLRGRQIHRNVSMEQTTEIDPSDDRPKVPLQSEVPSPDAMLEGTRLESAIQQQLSELDAEQRLLIVLRDVQGLSYQDILRITGLQEGTLKSRLHRARLALKERLRHHLR